MIKKKFSDTGSDDLVNVKSVIHIELKRRIRWTGLAIWIFGGHQLVQLQQLVCDTRQYCWVQTSPDQHQQMEIDEWMLTMNTYSVAFILSLLHLSVLSNNRQVSISVVVMILLMKLFRILTTDNVSKLGASAQIMCAQTWVDTCSRVTVNFR